MTRYTPVAAWQVNTAAGPKTYWAADEHSRYFTSHKSVLTERRFTAESNITPALLITFDTVEDYERWIDDAQVVPEPSPHFIGAAHKEPA